MDGKGSRPRVVDIDQYNANYDKIFGKKGGDPPDQSTSSLDGSEQNQLENRQD
jgi:hypothetical protein